MPLGVMATQKHTRSSVLMAALTSIVAASQILRHGRMEARSGRRDKQHGRMEARSSRGGKQHRRMEARAGRGGKQGGRTEARADRRGLPVCGQVRLGNNQTHTCTYTRRASK